jgi:hypothetical protein
VTSGNIESISFNLVEDLINLDFLCSAFPFVRPVSFFRASTRSDLFIILLPECELVQLHKILLSECQWILKS